MVDLNDLSLEYSFWELQKATNNFDKDHRLGVGTFGGVFRGIQRDGTEIAIKVLGSPEEAGFEEEVRVLSKFRHPNLVILMGFAKNGPERLLVYEHLGGGDVFMRLRRCSCDGVPFTWKQRISAAFDASCGLSHLHNSTPKVFHRDIKCPNILLDRNGTAKMADFGLACCSHAKEAKVQQAAGTVGYACPHYVSTAVVTERSEVYSFGIVLLELLTAMPPASSLGKGPDGKEQFQFLVTVLGYSVPTALQSLDRKAGFPPDVAAQFAELGLRCTMYEEEHRPFFTDVVTRLRQLHQMEEVAPPPPPPPPPPLHQGYSHSCAQGYTVPAVAIQQQQLQRLQQQLQQQQMHHIQLQLEAQRVAQQMAPALTQLTQLKSKLAEAQVTLTEAQADELRLQYLTDGPPTPPRQVSLPMPEMERYYPGHPTVPACGGSSMLAHRSMTQARPLKKMAWTFEPPCRSHGGFGFVVPGGISFVGDDVEPVFVLEVGTTVRGKRCMASVVHGPLKSDCAAAPGCEVPCPPLKLGSVQEGFWSRILDKTSVSLLEPEHLMIEVDEAATERRFYVRNLSKLPVRVEGPAQEIIRQEEDGRWQIQHGDTILLSLTKGTSMWMNFRVK